MSWELNDKLPIWPQLKEQMARDIVIGKYATGSHFPTVRELAQDAKVNRNTMQRALQSLEEDGLLITNRTVGRTVTSDKELIDNMRRKLAKSDIEQFKQNMESLGLNIKDIIKLMKEEE